MPGPVIHPVIYIVRSWPRLSQTFLWYKDHRHFF